MWLFLFSIGLLLAVLIAGYFFFCVVMMFRNVSPGRLRLAALLPLALLDESLFNETGNIYRKRALAINVLLLIPVLVVLVKR
jgi:hypothetical protein